MGVGLLALVPVSIVLSDDVARWGVVKHVGYRLQTNAIENAFYRRFLELMQAKESANLNLPKLEVSISEKKLKALLDKMPESMKAWQKGSLEGLGYSGRMKLRLAGDSNPDNFIGKRKSFRIKVPKDAEILGSRKFILKPSVNRSAEHQALTYLVAESLGVLAPVTIPVNLIVNGNSWGAYFLREVLDERFLRNRNILPGEIYKGDRSGKLTSAESDIYPLGLFNQTSNWKKLSRLNRLREDDFSVLQRSLAELWNLGNGPGVGDQVFPSRWDLDSWARYAVLEAVTGHTRQDLLHNQRLLFDDQLGRFFPVVWDYEMRISDRDGTTPRVFDSRSPIVFRLLRLPDFHEIYLAMLLDLYRDSKNGKCVFTYLCEDAGQTGHIFGSGEAFSEIGDPLRSRELLNFYISSLVGTEVKQKLLDIWKSEIHHFVQHSETDETSISVGKNCMALSTAAHDIVDQVKVKWSGVTEWADLPFFSLRANEFNRGPPNCELSQLPDCLLVGSTESERREYSIPLFQNTALDSVHLSFRSGAEVEVNGWIEDPDLICAIAPNSGLNDATRPNVVLGPGELKINKTRVFHTPTKILPGTTILLSGGASLIFRDQVEMLGTETEPIVFRPDPNSSDRSWGVVAIIGANTANSTILNVDISGGGVSHIESIKFLGMLSIHDSRNLLLEGLELFDNKAGDDALHLVYVKDSVIRDIRIHKVLADAIDVDIGENIVFDTIQIENAGNDCLDLMTSTVVVKRSLLKGCGDKALSVGERSTLLIAESSIENSTTGVAAKDESLAIMVDVKFSNNSEDVTEARKNLAYRYKGRAAIAESGAPTWRWFQDHLESAFPNEMIDSMFRADSTDSHVQGQLEDRLFRVGAQAGYVGVFAPQF